jgi:hypothetical protein
MDLVVSGVFEDEIQAVVASRGPPVGAGRIPDARDALGISVRKKTGHPDLCIVVRAHPVTATSHGGVEIRWIDIHVSRLTKTGARQQRRENDSSVHVP